MKKNRILINIVTIFILVIIASVIVYFVQNSATVKLRACDKINGQGGKDFCYS
jgi:uncharacterized protein YpmB